MKPGVHALGAHATKAGAPNGASKVSWYMHAQRMTAPSWLTRAAPPPTRAHLTSPRFGEALTPIAAANPIGQAFVLAKRQFSSSKPHSFSIYGTAPRLLRSIAPALQARHVRAGREQRGGWALSARVDLAKGCRQPRKQHKRST